MRKPLSICFLLLFLFNLGGYYLVYFGLSYRAGLNLEQRIESNRVEPDETFLIKLPVTLPYQLNQEGYERVQGEFEYNGKFYKLVKQKIENDTLYVVCVNDHHQGRLARMLSEFTKFTNELPSDLQQEGNILLSKLGKDFNFHPVLEIVSADRLYTETLYANVNVDVIQRDQPVATPPPDSRL